MDIASVELVDSNHANLIRNHRFSDGMDRWYTTDDSHLCWRIENEYVSTLYDGGLLRLVPMFLLLGCSQVAASRGLLNGVAGSTAFIAGTFALLLLFVFDTPLQAPRLRVPHLPLSIL